MAAQTPIQQAIQQVGNQIVTQMKANLQRNNNDNTGRLANSITATVEGTTIWSDIELRNISERVNWTCPAMASPKKFLKVPARATVVTVLAIAIMHRPTSD